MLSKLEAANFRIERGISIFEFGELTAHFIEATSSRGASLRKLARSAEGIIENSGRLQSADLVGKNFYFSFIGFGLSLEARQLAASFIAFEEGTLDMGRTDLLIFPLPAAFVKGMFGSAVADEPSIPTGHVELHGIRSHFIGRRTLAALQGQAGFSRSSDEGVEPTHFEPIHVRARIGFDLWTDEGGTRGQE